MNKVRESCKNKSEAITLLMPCLDENNESYEELFEQAYNIIEKVSTSNSSKGDILKLCEGVEGLLGGDGKTTLNIDDGSGLTVTAKNINKLKEALSSCKAKFYEPKQPSPREIAEMELKKEILDEMGKINHSLTVTEIQRINEKLCKFSIIKITTILKKLEKEGKVIHISDSGKIRYGLI